MIILIDNGDAFSYSLSTYFEMLGTKVRLLNNKQLSIEELVEQKPRALICTSGFSFSSANSWPMNLLATFDGQFPILGVSSGHQFLAQEFGATLCPAPQPVYGKAIPVYHDGQTIFNGIPSPFLAARYHALMVDRESLPDCWEISAWTEEGLIMGIRHKEMAIEGVQFRPESILTEQGLSLLRNFLHVYSLVEK